MNVRIRKYLFREFPDQNALK